MAAEEMIFGWLTPRLVTSSVGFLLTVILTTMLSRIFVKMGSRYGKRLGSNEFQTKEKLYWAFLIEAIVLSAAFAYFESAIDSFLMVNLNWLPSILVEAFVVYYVWFCVAFNFRTRLPPVLVPQIVLVLNYFAGIRLG
jgi:hypothetical protein